MDKLKENVLSKNDNFTPTIIIHGIYREIINHIHTIFKYKNARQIIVWRGNQINFIPNSW